MNAATVHDLVLVLNHGLETTTRTDEIFAEVVDNVGRTGQWVDAGSYNTLSEIVTVSAAATLEVLAAFVQGYELSRERSVDLDIHPDWREELGVPEAYTVDTQQDHTLRLYPRPDRNYGVTLFYATRRTSFQSWLAPWMALEVTRAEFQREGPEQDMEYAQAVMAIADILARGVLKIATPEGP